MQAAREGRCRKVELKGLTRTSVATVREDSGHAVLLLSLGNERKASFPFAFRSFFRNFGRNLKLSLFIGGLRNNAIFEVTNWKPSDFRILPRSAFC